MRLLWPWLFGGGLSAHHFGSHLRALDRPRCSLKRQRERLTDPTELMGRAFMNFRLDENIRLPVQKWLEIVAVD